MQPCRPIPTSIKRRVSRFNGDTHVRSDCYRWQAAQSHRRRIPQVEKLDVATGEAIDFDRVLLVANGEDVKIGLPVVEGAKVTAEVVSHGRHDKVRIIKFRRRKHHMKRQGHRQWFTEIKITGIQA